jgi:ABC-type Mn2+/Zn2+ transport system ATPase subunit
MDGQCQVDRGGFLFLAMNPVDTRRHRENAVEATGAHVCWGGDHADHPHHQLRVHGLNVSYGAVRALEDVSFASECGRCLALVGPNGAGKSTLLKSLAGILPIDEGRILWRGAPLTAAHRELAYLPQRGDIDWSFPITVRGLVDMGRYPNVSWWRPFNRHDRAIVERALEVMQLTSLAGRQINALSGGQQQRTFIARALAQEAHVLLLDEPFAGLDQPAEETLRRLLRDLAAEGRLIIASHHDLDSVNAIFDEVLMLRRAAIAFGPVTAVFTPDTIARTYAPLPRPAATQP